MDETPPVPRTAPAIRALVVASMLVLAVGVSIELGFAAVPAAAADSAQPATVLAQPVEGSGPSPTGQPLPPKSQRIADSVIAVLLVATLAGALVAVATAPRWNRRRRDGAAADDG